ncbi:TIGR02678 family protein [Solibacillus sp. FSL H8-0538]|uniref:TIGR02678 family protein n=1 Tax=Solibacillus sp. FSL H8-0538 TaxID=2921400 RepID=UPI0030FA0B07
MAEELLFDEKAVQGLDYLLQYYWILREEQPDIYRIVREREKVLRRYIDEKFGMRLIVHQHFIKLEKIPVMAESWMGIKQFSETMDYTVFCCALGFLESKSVDEQFLLSEACEEIRLDCPEELEIDWTLFSHRKTLIRVMKTLLDFSLIRTIDGDLNRFDHNDQEEVLYEATIYSRYFMRTYPDDFTSYTHWEQLLQEDLKFTTDDERRKRVYRRLFMSPGMHRVSQNDPDFLYIRNFRNRLSDDIEKHSEYKLHVFKNVALLSHTDTKQHHQQFPNTKAVSDLILQLSHYIHTHSERYQIRENGEIILTESQFNQIVDDLKQQFGLGWSKYFRDKSTNAIRIELVGALEEWIMAECDDTFIKIKPLLGVLAGSYPNDYEGGTLDESK